MSQRKGYIYIIKNDINDKVYVGQTARDIQIRFQEHCWDSRNIFYPSELHNAIKDIGIKHFFIEPIEEVELENLDERQKYWIKKYNSSVEGYNKNTVKVNSYIKVIENGIIFNNLEELSDNITKYTSWNYKNIYRILSEIINTDKTFCSYHFIYEEKENFLTDEITIEDWIITLNIRNQGKKIHCVQLEKDFKTVAEAANYILENNLYLGTSKKPFQHLISIINKQIKGKKLDINCIKNNLEFIILPGAIKENN